MEKLNIAINISRTNRLFAIDAEDWESEALWNEDIKLLVTKREELITHPSSKG